MDYWQGERVRLRGIEPEDGRVFFEWNRDSEMARYLDRIWFPTSAAFVKQWSEKAAIEGPTGDQFTWVIVNNQGEMVGSINSHHCDRRVGVFRYGVAVRREHQRMGYAAEAIGLVLRYFFRELRYQKVNAVVHSDNDGSMRLHQRLGFQQEGRLRRMVFTGGQWVDEIYFGMTLEEFEAVYPIWGSSQDQEG